MNSKYRVRAALSVTLLPIQGAHVCPGIYKTESQGADMMSNRLGFPHSLVSAVILLISVLALAGCGSQQFAISENDPFPSANTIKGQVFGGHQPVGNATVKLYSVGTTGYGSAGDLYATTSTSTDGNASFSFTQTTLTTPPTGPISPTTPVYACPTSNPQMYIVISGGNTQGGTRTDVNNTAAVSAVAIGPCNSVGSLFVDLNEVTTVGTMAALQQYFNPVTETFGYPNTSQAIQGFANGVATISNLVNISTGTAVASTTVSAVPSGSTNTVSVTIAPEINKINLLANIMAQCVNTTSNTSSACTTLFSAATPPTAAFTSQPTQSFTSITASNEDVLQALYFMLTNPTSGGATNMNALFNSTVANPPFSPAYSSAPTDWTIGIRYSSSTACTNSTSANISTSTFLNYMYRLAVDASGNVWGISGTSSPGGNLIELSPVGIPLTCGLGTLASAGSDLAIDANGYVWASSQTAVNSAYYLYKWSPTAGLDSSWPTNAIPRAIVADGYNNIFYVASAQVTSFSSTGGSVNEFAGAGAVGASSGAITTQQIATIFNPVPFMAVDSSDRIWIAITNLSGATSQAVFDIYPSNNTSGSTYIGGTSDGLHTGFETANVGDTNTYSPYGIAVGTVSSHNVIDTVNGAGSGSSGASYKWEIFTPSTTAGAVTSTVTSRSLGGTLAARGLAVDGASNIWSPSSTATNTNYVTGATNTNVYAIAEISSTGVAISATSTTGYGNNSGGFQKDPTILPVAPRSISIDPTGNVWIGSNASSSSSITELVGAAVPVVTPLSIGMKTNTLGAMP